MSPLQADGMSRANAAILMLTRSKDQYVGKAFLRYLRNPLKYWRDHDEAIAAQHDVSTGEHALLRAICSSAHILHAAHNTPDENPWQRFHTLACILEGEARMPGAVTNT
ncbi:hypothetical protein PQR02_21460 [Paraburkholderia sediminicola]|uniref:Uncharacterized protein n=1 Tax=Paraburkholderia rhynchosiae TaxID=487049 RepID=A0ACC7NEQ6_9BURK